MDRALLNRALLPALLLAPALSLGLPSCSDSATVDASAAAPATEGRFGRSLPSDWRELPSAAFEELLLGAPPAPDDATYAELEAGLSAAPAVATRAALLLAWMETERADELLLARLEQRVAGPAREDDAGDYTAARSLARTPRARDTRARLIDLVTGENPHPDVEVRAECAVSALLLGDESGIPYLLAVLRIDTAEALRRGEKLTDSPTTAWVRGRAAEILCAHLGLEHRVWTDAPLEVREAKALELERIVSER